MELRDVKQDAIAKVRSIAQQITIEQNQEQVPQEQGQSSMAQEVREQATIEQERQLWMAFETVQSERTICLMEEGNQMLTEIDDYIKTDQAPKEMVGLGLSLDLCVVCGDRTSGRHYGAMSCTACKLFFMLSIRKQHRYQCKESKSCEVTKHNKNHCQYCRLQKCLAMGMRSDLVQHEKKSVLGEQRRVSMTLETLERLITIVIEEAQNRKITEIVDDLEQVSMALETLQSTVTMNMEKEVIHQMLFEVVDVLFKREQASKEMVVQEQATIEKEEQGQVSMAQEVRGQVIFKQQNQRRQSMTLKKLQKLIQMLIKDTAQNRRNVLVTLEAIQRQITVRIEDRVRNKILIVDIL